MNPLHMYRAEREEIVAVWITTHGVDVKLGDYPADVARLIETELRWQIETCIGDHITDVHTHAFDTTHESEKRSLLLREAGQRGGL